MQKYKRAAISIAFLTLIFTAGLSSGYSVYNKNTDDPDDDKIVLLSTFENNDYKLWKKVVGKRKRVDKLVSQADFQQFVEARSAVRSGDYDKALAIASVLEDKFQPYVQDISLS
jgi:hypothetical protein